MCYFPSNCVAYFSFAVSIGILVSVVFYLVSLFWTGLVSFLSSGLAAIILGLLASENSVVRSATLKEMEGADIGSKAELLSALRMWMDEA